MPKDYKDSPSSRGNDSKLSHPLLLGMIIGLLLGIVISLAVALWLNRLANPFVEKGKAPEITSKIAPAQPAPPPSAAKAAEDAAKAAKPANDKTPAKSERPRFEFYNILPGDKDTEKPAPKTASAPTPAPAAVPRPGSSPASPKPHSGDVYWLQAGAFTDEKEADNLKAKIAFTGLEASVRSVDIADKGKLYRVRLGPYQSLDDANRIKSALSQNGVGAAIIRINEDSKNP
ncbi:MAG TPA: SPOR domain-containing protein [Usitatibacter sp.]|jgi:cell division protein FtsN|nr:SPOR domain-containing protein [Usitatibacter sp.]